MIDWQHIETLALQHYAEQLHETPQSERWHAEGDVLTHTQMVIEALHDLPEYQALSEDEQHILHLAALLHDIGKTITTRFEAGEWHAPHHAPVGSRMAREWFIKESVVMPLWQWMPIREAICLLVRYHSFPVHAIDMPDVRLRLHRIAANSQLAPLFSLKLLCMLSKADMLGRICSDTEDALQRIAMCEELAKEERCYEGSFCFPSPYTQRAYLSGRDVWKEQQLYDDTWGEVVLMSGLPGTGKDTYIHEHLGELPMISLDNIRREKRISPKAEQGYVANIAREQAKEYLRRQQPFVWNATNITLQMREQLVSLFETYHARVRIIYLETDWQTLLQRNASRTEVVPTTAIEQMLQKLTPPETYESTQTDWICVPN